MRNIKQELSYYRFESPEGYLKVYLKDIQRLAALRNFNKVRSPSESSKELNTVLSDRDKSCFQYLGGYVLHNLHNKHKTKTSSESQRAVAILKAGKSETNDHSQNLMSSVTQGGLWFITQPAQKFFFQTEYFFRKSTSKVGLQKVDFPFAS